MEKENNIDNFPVRFSVLLFALDTSNFAAAAAASTFVYIPVARSLSA
jgi:hypothetical protein